ncbi:MAG: thiaminase II [Thermomicrobia bacterium]|nr:thiaminase II [Thermomicrobia bacterium]
MWEAQLTHPFLVALGDGTLPQENFQFYILQDARFLTDLAKMFGFAATKTSDRDRAMVLAERLINTVNVERALHEGYAARFGMTPEAMATVPMAPTNYAYTRHMLQIGAMGTLAETLTAMLPCAWIYAVVGRHFTAQGEPPGAHPYRDWLLTYANVEFEAVGVWMRGVIDDEASRLDEAGRERLRDIFRTSSRYEYMFWDMAWKRESWPV